ncbi:MAG: hypothetical protein QNJ90_15650 [Planctomycetota bacterium]|nr:hypothetical protein [Planctomycetota bacterium]
MKLTIFLSLLSLGVAVGAGAYLYSENAALKDRIATLETPLADGEDPARPGATPALQGSGARRELAELRGLTRALTERMTSLERTAAEAPAAGGVAIDAGALADKPAFTEAVREVVLDMAKNDVDLRARLGTQERTKLGKDAPFALVAETLKLDASQESQMNKDLQEIQQELFALLSEERDDGVVPLELIAKAEELKDGDPKKAETFMKLFTLKVPGGEDTYMQRAVQLGTSFRKKIDTYLRPAQLEILDAVEIDWFSVKFN